MKRALFIDRDGTIIREPEDFQIDSLEKLEFLPAVLRNLYRLYSQTDFEFVMVTNQDGLGTASFPEETFHPAHNAMLKTLHNEGIEFSAIHIDRSFPHEQLPTRKPGTAMLTEYMTGEYNLAESYVIGDRLTDIQLAENIGAQAIYIHSSAEPHSSAVLTSDDWTAIADYILERDTRKKLAPRTASVHRVTKETDILVNINLDGTGKSTIHTGIGFFNHMLDQLARHSSCDLTITAHGDLHIDEHHTIEDTAITLGEAFAQAIGDKRGMERYGFLLPMDEALAFAEFGVTSNQELHAAIDFGGRNWLVWSAEFHREKIGDMPTEMFYHFFKSFTDSAKCTLNVHAEADNEHHKIEAIFKAVARAIKAAIRRDIRALDVLPTTKGVL